MFEVLLFSALAVLIGFMFLFAGYPFFRILLPVWGFFAGLVFCIQGFDSLMGTGFLSVSLGLFFGFFAGLLLAALTYFFYAFAVYLYGMSLGYILGQGFMLALGFEYGILTFTVGIVGAVAMTILFLAAKMPKFIIILTTAAGGAMAIMTGVFMLFGKVPTIPASLSLSRELVSGSWFWIIVWAVLAGFGFAVQYAMTKREELTEVYVWGLEEPVKK